MRMSRLSAAVVVAAFVLLSAFIPAGAQASPGAASTEPLTGAEPEVSYVNGPLAVSQYTLTLITGDVLYLTRQGDGPWAAAVNPAPRPYGAVPFETYVDAHQGTFVVPADVLPLLPNVLDPYFFNIDYLVSNGLTDDKIGTVPAIVDYANPAAVSSTWDPAVFHASDLRLIHSAAVAIPKGHAADFARVLLKHGDGSALPGINRIWLDRVVKVDLDQSVPLIGGDYARDVLGFNGTGVNIAILDTGIDASHPDFHFADGTSKIVRAEDETCAVAPAPPDLPDEFCDHGTDDLFGHGTHVASIAAGTGAASGGQYTGVAPGANLMNIKVLNSFGFGYFSWIIKGMEDATLGTDDIRGNEPTMEADVISMSLGGSTTDGTDPASEAVNTLVDTYGVTIVVAAANFGSYFGVTNPGAATQAITVAASTKVGSPIISEASPTERNFAGNLMEFSP